MTIEAQIQAHLNDFDDAHNLNASDVGLGKYSPNHPIANVNEARYGVVYDRYLTPRKLKDTFDGILMYHGVMDEYGNPLPLANGHA